MYKNIQIIDKHIKKSLIRKRKQNNPKFIIKKFTKNIRKLTSYILHDDKTKIKMHQTKHVGISVYIKRKIIKNI